MVWQKRSASMGSKAVPACYSICSRASLTGETATVRSRMPMVTTFLLGSARSGSIYNKASNTATPAVPTIDFTHPFPTPTACDELMKSEALKFALT